MTLTVIMYIVYILLCTALTAWVAEVLFGNARIFFDDIFHGDEALSDSTNKLLKLGFYLLNFGFVLFLMDSYKTINNQQVLFEELSVKIGTIILIVGFIYLVNIYGFFKLRRKAKQTGGFQLTDNAKMQLAVIEKEELGEA